MSAITRSILVLCLLAAPSVADNRATQPLDDYDDENNEQYEMDEQESRQQLAAKIQAQLHPQKILLSKAISKQPGAAPAPAGPEEHAQQAKEAASAAKQAAHVANQVAKHSIKVTGHAKKALKHALGALHDARVESEGLGKEQKASLKKAEARLREATKKAEYGKLKEDKSATDKKKDDMQNRLDAKGNVSEKEQMKAEIEELRKTLKRKNAEDADTTKELDTLEAEIDHSDGAVDDESKAELERLRKLIDALEEPAKEEASIKNERARLSTDSEAVTPVRETGIDIDTQMPYGDLEPFGREDTAQELTESSVRESDEMVDQLERAEVAEEKRSVFRALTRLRGAAITSFDGVARSQTGNIDEYNKIHKWRGTHPMHHLADEESDITKWAFPNNAD